MLISFVIAFLLKCIHFSLGIYVDVSGVLDLELQQESLLEEGNSLSFKHTPPSLGNIFIFLFKLILY